MRHLSTCWEKSVGTQQQIPCLCEMGERDKIYTDLKKIILGSDKQENNICLVAGFRTQFPLMFS